MADEFDLTQYGLMAERHWREFCPAMVRKMEAHGTLRERSLRRRRERRPEILTRQMETEQKLTPQQAHDRAWEMIR